MRIKIKPLSINECFQGRRFKTKAYKFYEDALLLLLGNKTIAKDTKLKLVLKIGFSNKAADIDNPVKPIIDILQKKYGFNDKWIYKLHIVKDIVKKGEEYFEFCIEELDIKT